MLTPLFGFSAITAPEVTAEFKEIKEGNWYYKRKVIIGANASNMTLQRGATFYDSDFWRWMNGAITGAVSSGQTAGLKIGSTSPRRQLVLTQYLTRPVLFGGSSAGDKAGSVIASALLAGGLSTTGSIASGSDPVGGLAANTAGVAVSAALAGIGLGPFEFTARIPAKCWVLHGCLPARYKAAGDFDASSSAISIQELEISVEAIEEVALTA